MVGLDAIGGISFEKGCYPGQEIVARARYLGEVKRHLHRGHTSGEAQAGEALVTAGRSAGMIVQSARAPGGGSDFLAVVQDASAEEALHLRDAEGPTASLSGPLHRVIAV
jgi:folate-binding Fe-S cluster repair protein YgfZ